MQTGDSLRRLREAKPLVHQITNYVVMNETANATLALGALPVMAHAREEVEEMVAIAGALVLNIGTLSPRLGRGDAARGPGRQRARRAGRARPGRRRCDDLSHRNRETAARRGERDRAARKRRRGRHARRRGRGGARRRVDRRGRRSRCELARKAGAAARARRVGHRAGRPRLRRERGRGRRERPPSDGVDHRDRAACRPPSPAASSRSTASVRSKPPRRRSSHSGWPARRPPAAPEGPGSFHVALYDALAALDPATLDAKARTS